MSDAVRERPEPSACGLAVSASPALEVELLCLICRRTCGVVRKRLSSRLHFVGERQRTYGIVPVRSADMSAYLADCGVRSCSYVRGAGRRKRALPHRPCTNSPHSRGGPPQAVAVSERGRARLDREETNSLAFRGASCAESEE